MTISSVAHALGKAYKKAKHSVSSTAHAVGDFTSKQYHALGNDVSTVYNDIKGGISGAGHIMNNATDKISSSVQSIGNNVEGISGNLQLPIIAGIGLAALFMMNQ